MGVNSKLVSRVRQALAHLPAVEEKKMFGGVAFMVNRKMCITVGAHRIMCRIDPSLQDEVVKNEGASPVIMRGRLYKGFVHVDEELLKSDDALQRWVNLALDFNPHAKASTKNRN